MRLQRKALYAALQSIGATLNRHALQYMHRTGLLLTALPFEVDKLEDVPEAFRGEYALDAETKKYRAQIGGLDDYVSPKTKQHIASLNDENTKRRLREKESVERYKDIDPDKYRALMEQIDKDEDMKLRSQGKHDEANRLLTERMTKTHQLEIKTRDDALATAKAEVDKVHAEYVREHIARAAADAGVHDNSTASGVAADLAIKAGFVYDPERRAVVLKDAGGAVVLGKDGKTPLSAKEWAGTELREQAAFLFPNLNTGGGATGSGSQGVVTGNFAGMSPQEKLNRAREQQEQRGTARR